MPRCLVALGSNLGDRARQLDEVVARLRARADLRVTGVSSWHATQPVGGPGGQGEFLNGALTLDTALAPLELWGVLRELERGLGRRRDVRWGPRTIDLDLLLYDELRMAERELELPHPRMAFRRFVLAPACEIAGDWPHPEIGWKLSRILEYLSATPPSLAVIDFSSARACSLARAVAEALGALCVADPVGDSAVPRAGRAPRLTGAQMESAESTGSGLGRAIEFESRRDAAWRAAIDAAAGRMVVAPFWPHGAASSGPFAKEHGIAPCPPRLMALAIPSDASLELVSLVDETVKAARARGVGPMLRVLADDPRAARDEIVAAALASAP